LAALASLLLVALAEVFARRRHMALPSIVLTLTFVGAVFLCVFLAGRNNVMVSLALASGAALIAGYAHWRRSLSQLRSPLSVCGRRVADSLGERLRALRKSSVRVKPDRFRTWGRDLSDRNAMDRTDLKRTTRRSDVAFWLHLLAAPLIVHPVFSALGVLGGSATSSAYVVVLAIYVLLALVSLALDRRALLVSALVYALVALELS